jgi:hypothetical protein
MPKLPKHGRVNCTRCFQDSLVEFDKTTRTENGWRIKFNPLAWGNEEPEIIVLGFSKGPTQAGALAKDLHNEIACKKSRLNVGKILSHIGLIPSGTHQKLKSHVDNLIADTNGRFHFASLIRCTVERHDQKTDSWKGSGGGMLDKFVSNPFGQFVATNCTKKFLSKLPEKTKIVILFGLGSKMNYVSEAYNLFQNARPGNWRKINSVAYTDGIITVVHVEHFASQGALIPNWIGENNHERGRLGIEAREAVKAGLK